jgi:hypothetical protein
MAMKFCISSRLSWARRFERSVRTGLLISLASQAGLTGCSNDSEKQDADATVQATAARPRSGPMIYIDRSSFRGPVVDGVVKHAFQIQNTGQEPLVIKRVVPNCGCTIARWNGKPIPPGHSAAIEVSLNVVGSRRSSRILLESNDENNKYVTLVIQADNAGAPELTFVPYRIRTSGMPNEIVTGQCLLRLTVWPGQQPPDFSKLAFESSEASLKARVGAPRSIDVNLLNWNGKIVEREQVAEIVNIPDRRLFFVAVNYQWRLPAHGACNMR